MPSFFGKPKPTTERTAADRERERLERQRRRSSAAGEPVPPMQGGEDGPGAGGFAPVEPVERAVPSEAGAPLEAGGSVDAGVPFEAAAPVDDGGSVDAGAPLEAVAPVDAGAPLEAGAPFDEGAPVDAGAPREDVPPIEPGAPVEAGALLVEAEPVEPVAPVDAGPPIEPVVAATATGAGGEPPAAPTGRRSRAEPLPAPPPRRRGGGAATGRPPRAPRARRRVTPGRVIAAIVLVLVVGAVWFGIELFEPFTGSGHGRVVVDVPHGAGASEVGDLLASKGVVASGFFFNLYAAVEGERGSLNSGRFVLRQGMSYSAALNALTQAPAAPPVVNVVVPEGDSRTEIAAIARADGLAGDYLSASVRSPVLAPARYGAPRGTPNLEGFLFPATYSLAVGANVRALVSDQLVAFTQNVGHAYAHAAHRLHLTTYQLLIVASMIEREAYLSGDRAKVAAVIYNRLRLAMPLGIDATLRYALNDWTSPLTESQLQLSSPYNTRLRIGLPPTPIGNPGLAALNAAAHPAKVPYLYYVDGADGCGELVFTTSAAAFDQAAAAYQAALKANNGRVPACHKR